MTAASTRTVLAAAAVLLLGTAAVLGRGPQEPSIDVHPVAGTVAYLVGQGGNIGVCHGPDGVLLVDDQFLRLAEAIEKAVEELAGEGAPAYLINTHWHGDHTGGNEHFGRSATILAHANVRRRLVGDASIGGRVAEDTPGVALPVVTYSGGVSVHFNGEEIRLVHVPTAHTDGDTVVWFTGSNVVHMGDLYFQLGYPFVDVASGGDVEGLIAGVKRILELVPDDARVIAGHGDATGTDGLREYLAMLETLTERVRELLAEGFGVDEMMEAGVTEDFDARWGGFAFVPPRRFVETIVACLSD